MAVLKVKDLQGQWQNIPAIEGNGIASIQQNADYTLTITFDDGTTYTTSSVRGATGNGINRIEKTGTVGLVDTYTIYYTDGNTWSYQISNGGVTIVQTTGQDPNKVMSQKAVTDEFIETNSAVDAIEEKIPSEATSSNKLADKSFVTDITDAIESDVDAIESDVDTIEGKIPSAASSSNKLTDKAYVDDAIDDIQDEVDAINGKIPAQASTSNQLADKNFVNSSIATETAHYISDNGQPFNSVYALEQYTGTITNNDYAFVTGTDAQGNTYFDRYKASKLNGGAYVECTWDGIFTSKPSGTVVAGGSTTTYYQMSQFDVAPGTTFANGFVGALIQISSFGEVTDEQRIGNSMLTNYNDDILVVSGIFIATSRAINATYEGKTYNFPSAGIWCPDEGHEEGSRLDVYVSYIKYGGVRYLWAKEYRLNNSSFTAAQWSAISSGITSGKVENYDGHLNRTDNPHEVTKAQVGLGNVDNTSDVNKPISTATQTALNGKQASLVSGTNIKTINAQSILGSGNVAVGTITADDSTVGNPLPGHLYRHTVLLTGNINGFGGNVLFNFVNNSSASLANLAYIKTIASSTGPIVASGVCTKTGSESFTIVVDGVYVYDDVLRARGILASSQSTLTDVPLLSCSEIIDTITQIF